MLFGDLRRPRADRLGVVIQLLAESGGGVLGIGADAGEGSEAVQSERTLGGDERHKKRDGVLMRCLQKRSNRVSMSVLPR